jgi:acyl carrier protein
MKNLISTDDIYKIIAKILKTTPAKIIKTDKLNSIKTWDSLAQLDILSALDAKLGNQLSNLNDIASITSVKKLIKVLKKKSLIK